MKTLRIKDGDFCFDETGHFFMIEGADEIAQAVEMCLSIEKGEFLLDEFVGIDTSFMQEKNADDEDVANALIEAVEVLTEEEKIESLDNIEASIDGRTCVVSSLDIVIVEEESTINIEGVEIGGS